MAYLWKEDIDEKEYQQFIQNSSLVSFMQDNAWGQVKENWKAIRVGMYEENVMVAGALVLIQHIALHLHIAYVPRGYVIDFSNTELLKAFTCKIKELAKRNRCYVVKIDPYFCNQETSIIEIEKGEATGIPIIFSKDYQIKHNNLVDLGYLHKGYVKKIDKTLQPRFHMMVPLVNQSLHPFTEEELLKSFQKRTRSYCGNYHQKRGVFYEHSRDRDRLDEFVSILNCTENRQGIHLRNKHYFESIMEHYGEQAILFFGKLDLSIYLHFLEQNQGKEEEIKQVKDLLDQGESIITLSAALVIMPSNKEGTLVSEYLYAGNQLLFSKLQVSVGLVYDICKYSLEHHCTYCNLGGVDGTLDDHLTKFKARFNSIVMEFIGEYDLPISPISYRFIDTCMPLLKKGYHFIKRNHS